MTTNNLEPVMRSLHRDLCQLRNKTEMVEFLIEKKKEQEVDIKNLFNQIRLVFEEAKGLAAKSSKLLELISKGNDELLDFIEDLKNEILEEEDRE